MKFFKFSFLFLFIFQFSYAQKQKFTMAEAVNGMRSNLAVKNISGFAWSEDGKNYYKAVKNAYVSTDLKSGKIDTIISLSKINQSLSTDLKLKNLPPVQFNKENKAYFVSNGNYYWLEKSGNFYEIKSNSKLEDGAENIKILEDRTIIYTIKNNLFALKNGQKISITNDSEAHIVNGQAAHRSEFGIVDGTFPSPDNKNVAFYRMDETMVADYPIIDWSETPAKNVNIKYPMAGQKSHEVTLGVYNFKNEKTTFLKIEGDPEQYLTAISWSPDSRFIFVGVLNRGQNHLQLNQYNSENGAFIKTLFEEKDAKYVEPQNPLLFFPNSTTDFVWQSQRTGYNHLYHYNIEKGLISQMTKGDWLVTEILGFNEKKKDIYFTSTKETPLEKHLYRINWNTFKIEKLDSEAGVHSGILSRDGNLLLDVYSNAETPRKVNIINTSTLVSNNLLSAPNPLTNYQRPEIKNVTLKADDGTPLYGKIILPTDFDATKKYPVIVYLYNGPHLQLVTNTFPASGNLWYEYMAQRGYIVFTMDGRGSSNRGLKFEQAVHRNLGVNEMKDQMKGVEYLKSLPYVNSAKMGIHGWSFGGFMTTNLMLTHPDVFKAGVAGGPVIDWDLYEIMYTERYMDTPQENPEGYKNANLLNKVQNLKGKLLMIHGAQDNVVVWQHSMKFLKAAVDHDIQLDYFVYPGHEHNVRGKDRVHLMQKVTDYFDLYLKN